MYSLEFPSSKMVKIIPNGQIHPKWSKSSQMVKIIPNGQNHPKWSKWWAGCRYCSGDHHLSQVSQVIRNTRSGNGADVIHMVFILPGLCIKGILHQICQDCSNTILWIRVRCHMTFYVSSTLKQAPATWRGGACESNWTETKMGGLSAIVFEEVIIFRDRHTLHHNIYIASR